MVFKLENEMRKPNGYNTTIAPSMPRKAVVVDRFEISIYKYLNNTK